MELGMSNNRDVGAIYIEKDNSFFLQLDDENKDIIVWLPMNSNDTVGMCNIPRSPAKIIQVVTRAELVQFLYEMAKRKNIDIGVS